MRVVMVGSGGREAALAWRLARSPSVSELVVTSDGPGWPARAVLWSGDWEARAVREGAGLVVVGPEQPLTEGLVDRLSAAGVPCFGPSAAAAALEGSKAFAKAIMEAAGVATAGAVVADLDTAEGRAAAEARARQGQVVVKADALAAGKGVIVCPGADEALAALDELRRYGARVVLEDLLTGPEVSLFALSDGERVVPLASAQDHKQLLDGGKGPNTGGMGAIVPCPLLDAAAGATLVREVHQPVVDAMRARGTPFRGLLYAGLMLTPDGPKVLEFNVRFGDPECQPLMMLWEDDPLPWLLGAATGQLPEGTPRFADGAACGVVLASAGYPEGKEVGQPIPEPEVDGVEVFLAGAQRDAGGVLRTAGGRVLLVGAVRPTLEAAREAVYAALPAHTFPGAQWRRDIGGAPIG